MPARIKMRQLLETGVHFGHRTQKWNPKMAPYIFTKRNGIHIIDLQQTLANIHTYYDMVRDLAADGGRVLFVGTKRQAAETIATEAQRCGMPYVNYRWLGGTLTNWRTIRERIDTLKKLEARRDRGEFDFLTKKEALVLQRKIAKLQLRLGGIREMRSLPDMLLVVDTEREKTAVKEANILSIPILGIVDTNGDPDLIDYVIPANDDAMRSIRLIVSTFADAIIEGKAMRKSADDDVEDFIEEVAGFEYDEMGDADEDLLGASTLAKLRDKKAIFDGDEAGDDEPEGEAAAADAADEDAADETAD